MKNRKGFTLIELLAVILILGIIALIAIPTVNSVIQQSRLGAWESTGNQLAKGLETYYQMCQIRDGYESNGTTQCDYNLADDTADKVKARIEVKGDLPDGGTSNSQYKIFNVDADGVALIDFTTTEKYHCKNAELVTDKNNVAPGASGYIDTWAVVGDGSVKCVREK
jgi:prepilin-type N-terminal cleavage/methylation domain-containing protein